MNAKKLSAGWLQVVPDDKQPCPDMPCGAVFAVESSSTRKVGSRVHWPAKLGVPAGEHVFVREADVVCDATE